MSLPVKPTSISERAKKPIEVAAADLFARIADPLVEKTHARLKDALEREGRQFAEREEGEHMRDEYLSSPWPGNVERFAGAISLHTQALRTLKKIATWSADTHRQNGLNAYDIIGLLEYPNQQVRSVASIPIQRAAQNWYEPLHGDSQLSSAYSNELRDFVVNYQKELRDMALLVAQTDIIPPPPGASGGYSSPDHVTEIQSLLAGNAPASSRRR